MRLVFAGTPAFARVALAALAQAGHEIVAVLTQPDRASGRGLALASSPVKQEAQSRGLCVMQPVSLREGAPGAAQTKAALIELAPDLMVVAAYGLILPRDVLEIPRHGCLNIHASLLPRWRGAAPIQRAIAAGDACTGIALMQMEEGLDTGPVWSMAQTPIFEHDNFQTLHDRLAELGAAEVVKLLHDFPQKGMSPSPQPELGVTYAKKISKDDTTIDWHRSAFEVACQIRSLDPAPGAQARLGKETIKLFDARVWEAPAPDALKAHGDAGPLDLKNASPGQIFMADSRGFVIACGRGAVAIGAAQRPGARRLAITEFLRGARVSAGQLLDTGL
jgi:methionyl-tRNA formyltransferase